MGKPLSRGIKYDRSQVPANPRLAEVGSILVSQPDGLIFLNAEETAF
jgi:hypothetical protein